MGKQLKELLINSLKYIDHYYNNFNFDFTNLNKLEVWHQALSCIPSDTLQKVVQSYCVSNVYPPSSPTSLIDHYKEMIVNHKEKGEIAFEKLIERIKDNSYDLDKTLNKYEKKIVPSIVGVMRSEFKQWLRGENSINYLKRDFVKHYNSMVVQMDNNQLKLEDKNERN
jgi:hypothetical protein